METLLSREAWARKYYPAAVEATKGTGIFPEVAIIISILEGQGKASDGNWYPGLGLTSRAANNPFGIKNYPAWRGATVELPTPGDSTKKSSFVKYPSLESSFRGFVEFLQRNPRYEKAGVFNAPGYVDQLVRLAKAGYSEDPTGWESKTRSIGARVKEYIKDLEQSLTDQGKLFPVLFALAVFAIFVLSSDKKA